MPLTTRHALARITVSAFVSSAFAGACAGASPDKQPAGTTPSASPTGDGTTSPSGTPTSSPSPSTSNTAPSTPGAPSSTPSSSPSSTPSSSPSSAPTSTPPAPPPSGTEVAPYFYTWGWGNTAYPFRGLVDLRTKSGIPAVTLAFVLSDGSCNPTHDIQDHLDDVKGFVAAGGHVKASFGGADGTYLEAVCTDARSLANAIEKLIDATGITDLDFDVEQSGVMNATVNALRGQALRLVQTERGAKVAFTLAANPRDKWGTPGGIGAAGVDVVKAAVSAGVKISHVNLMTMDYGGYYSDGKKMGDLAISCLTDANTQLLSIVPGLDEAGAWAMLGATPMIGVNDVSTEVFGIDDAKTLQAFAASKNLGLLAYWAINRDQVCPYDDLGVCSKVNTASYQFLAAMRGL